MAGKTGFNLNPSELVSIMRSWFFANDRSVILADNTFIEGENNSTPGNPVVNRGRLYWKQDQDGSWYQLNSNGDECRLCVGNIIIQDQKASGTNGGTFTSGAWRTRDLNTTVVNTVGSGFSLASNQFTLPAGDYTIKASAPATSTASDLNRHATRLRDITNGTTIIAGTSEMVVVPSGEAVTTRSFITGYFSISAPTIFEIQHQCATTNATDGFGLAVGASFAVDNELYTEVQIWKIT